MKTCTVIGGGLVGSACAVRLQRAGIDVTLIDPGDPRRGASWGNIGHIATEQVEPHASPANLRAVWPRLFAFGGPVDFRWRDTGVVLPWAMRLARASTQRTFEEGAHALSALLRDPLADWSSLLGPEASAQLLAPHGHAVVWMDPRRAQAGQRAWMSARTGTARVRSMEKAELDAYGAVLSRVPAGGVMFSGTGSVRSPQAVRDALWRALEADGGQRRHAEAMQIETAAKTARVRLGDGSVIEADSVLIAAGAWSGPLMARLGVRAPLIGEWGYSVQSAEHRWPDTLPTTVFEERSVVLSTFVDGLRASSFVEFGALRSTPDPRKWRAIEGHVRDLGVSFSERPDRWRGPRPTLPDYLPAIGRLESKPNVFYAFGHQHLGLTLAATTAALVEQLAFQMTPAVDLHPLRIERFR